MELPILIRFLFQGILDELNCPVHFEILFCVPSVLDMVLNISALHILLVQILMDLLFKYQVFHQTTLQIFVTI